MKSSPALEAYVERQAMIVVKLEELEELAEAHQRAGIHWGHVCDLDLVLERLNSTIDFLSRIPK